MSRDAQRCESPINGVHPQVCGEMISEIIFVLWDGQRRVAESMWCAHVSERLYVRYVQGHEQFVLGAHRRSRLLT